jgi:hypothetical protein
MIPYFVVRIVAFCVRPFGYWVSVSRRTGWYGVDTIHIARRGKSVRVYLTD